MKKVVYFALLCSCIFLLSSCLEITQYAGMENGRLIVDTRISVQKALVEMARSMGGEDNEDMFTSLNVEELRDSLPSDYLLAIDKFDSELEMGISLRVQYDPYIILDSDDTSIPVFFPYIDGQTLVVEIQSINSSAEAESNVMAAAIISGFKYRLFIGRSLMKAPNSAFIISDRGKIPATLIVYPEFSVVEISMGYILAAPSSIKLVVE